MEDANKRLDPFLTFLRDTTQDGANAVITPYPSFHSCFANITQSSDSIVEINSQFILKDLAESDLDKTANLVVDLSREAASRID